ncbi:MAG: iron ABC transporter permease [Planctomycetes bacterium]|uniref:ABC transporter permease n=1 Tax=Candidatus Wunengus sp. YC65 TaxID=3367701 RepID=UPI001E04FEB1|nr:iron ABC transporter permease [Planctomycetota bacterium]
MQKRLTLGFFFILFLGTTFLPIVWMFGNSVYEEGKFSFVYYKDIFLTQKYGKVISNSLILASLTTILSSLFGVPAGFFLSKTNLPLKKLFKICFFIPLIIPSYITGIAWVNLLGKTGFLNNVFSQYTMLSSESVSDFIYSTYGASFILSMNLFPVVMLVTEYALKSVNPRLEESGLVVGSVFQVFRQITLPLIAPAILSGMMIVFVLSLSEFGVPSLLQVNVLTTQIFTQFSAFYNEKAATAIAFPLIVITFILIMLEKIYMRGKSFEMLGRTSSISTTQYNITWLNVVGITFCTFVLLVCVIIPLSTLIFNTKTISAYHDAILLARNGITNSILFGSIGATFLTLIGFFLGYLSENIRSKLRSSIAAFIWIFFAVPATVSGIGLIKLWNRPESACQFIYSSLWIVILGYVIRFLPLSSRIMTNYLKQIPHAMEDAGTVTGASWFRILGKILLPLQGYGLIATWLISFMFCIGELGTTILVYPPGHETLPIALFTVMANSPTDVVSALSIIIVVMTLLPVGVFLVVSKYLVLKPKLGLQ